MHGVNSWAYHPYLPLTQQGKAMLPYVCRLAPGANAFAFEFFDQGFEGAHEIHLWRKGQSTPVTVLPLVGFEGFVEGLDTLTDYAFSVHRVGVAGQSDTRYVRTGKVPGTVIQYLHPEDDQYAFSGKSLCSPSIVRVPGGALLASMDVFASQYPQNLTLLYRSDDEGATWHYLTDLFPCFWGKLFVHKGALYMLATSTEYGDLLIGRSDDEGKTWTAPVRILPGSGKNSVGGPHKAPMPVIAYNGRLYTAIDYGTWNLGGHASGLLSIGEEEDLLVGSHWVCTPFLPYDPTWPGAAQGDRGSLLEGNAVVSPEGKICNFLRYQMTDLSPRYGKAAILEGDLENPEAPLRLHRVVDFNGGSNSKYTMMRDEQTGKYVAIVSQVVCEDTPAQRNVLSLAVSDDFYTWRNAKCLLDYRHENPNVVGFQYIDAFIDGEDILYMSRTAMNKPRNFHDANYATFHRIVRFRQYF